MKNNLKYHNKNPSYYTQSIGNQISTVEGPFELNLPEEVFRWKKRKIGTRTRSAHLL